MHWLTCVVFPGHGLALQHLVGGPSHLMPSIPSAGFRPSTVWHWMAMQNQCPQGLNGGSHTHTHTHTNIVFDVAWFKLFVGFGAINFATKGA